MDRIKSTWAWLEAHRDVGVDLVRIYVAIGLIVRGIVFVAHPEILASYISQSGWWAPFIIAQYVIGAHIAGGLLLLPGILTRGAALLQVPALTGAVFLVHAHDPLASVSQSLELSAMVLFLLFVLVAFGGGRLSVDYYLFGKNKRQPTEKAYHPPGRFERQVPSPG